MVRNCCRDDKTAFGAQGAQRFGSQLRPVLPVASALNCEKTVPAGLVSHVA